MLVHSFHASETGDELLPSLEWPALSVGSFFGRFTGRKTSCRPMADGADSGVPAESNEKL